ncbi:MAG TPA: nitrous oxide reductase accessory protein NosL [Candidatus Brocadiia bacterium]|nr:nitrous oxide reductase accessory protein NosL [Planctomycetota bacterium]MDO8093950.1 nitrous oxide reductase accessory protein NosL [Candidatus Brocadiales bacterium]
MGEQNTEQRTQNIDNRCLVSVICCLYICLTVVFGITGCAKRELPAFICDMCGMDVSKSETKYKVKLSVPATDGQPEKYACSFSCANMLKENLKDKVSAIETTDYNNANFIDINTATFVAHSDVIPRGSMPPSLLAFSSRQDAEQFVKTHKGRILGLEGVKKLIAEK